MSQPQGSIMNNPYSPPSADLQASSSNELELAGRGVRLGAAVIDSLISLAVVVPVVLMFGLEADENGNLSLLTHISLLILGLAVFLAIHGYLLKTSGQTVGKKLLGIRIVGMDNELRPLGDLILKRYVPVSAVGVIPVVGSILPLVNVLAIFRNDRRCIHDLIAGTKVVKC
jgi:uncharacterized RDD family membrane protein YckC